MTTNEMKNTIATYKQTMSYLEAKDSLNKDEARAYYKMAHTVKELEKLLEA